MWINRIKSNYIMAKENPTLLFLSYIINKNITHKTSTYFIYH